MRFLAHYNKPKTAQSAGFTLVEMLVIAPIVILMIGGFIGLMVTMVGDVMVSRDENQMMFDAQNALNAIEQDTRLSIQFMSATTDILSPQGTSGNYTGTGNFSNASNTLILRTLATDKNPTDSSRQLVYYANQPNACGGTQTSNQIFALTVVYFINNGSLWRRTIMPLSNTSSPGDINTVCGQPWQLNSCSPGYTASRCQTNDVELMRGVTSMPIKYYSSPSSSTDLGTSSASVASSINVTINGSKNVAGRAISTSQSIITTKLNETPQNIGPTALDISQDPSDQAVLATAKNVTFTSAANYNTASLQWQRSTNGGSTWTNISGATNGTLSLATVSLAMNNYRYRMVATDSGMTATSNAATLSTSTWLPIALQNDWMRYSTTYSAPEYSQTSSGLVVVRGLIKNGIATNGTVIGVLPSGLRPAGRIIFPTSTYDSAATATRDNTAGRIDVRANGEIVVVSGSSGWLAINFTFVPTGTQHSWSSATYSNGWSDWAGGYELMRATTDTTGRIIAQGLGSAGATATGTVMYTLPTALRPARILHFPSSTTNYNIQWMDPSGQMVKRDSNTVSNVGSSVAYFPSTYTNWTNLPLQSGWTAYHANYPPAQYTKTSDNIVTLQGLIGGGTVSTGDVIGTLPVGYRPTERMIFTTNTNTGYARVDVLPDGNIIVAHADPGWLALNNITFVAG